MKTNTDTEQQSYDPPTLMSLHVKPNSEWTRLLLVLIIGLMATILFSLSRNDICRSRSLYSNVSHTLSGNFHESHANVRQILREQHLREQQLLDDIEEDDSASDEIPDTTPPSPPVVILHPDHNPNLPTQPPNSAPTTPLVEVTKPRLPAPDKALIDLLRPTRPQDPPQAPATRANI